MDAETCAPVVGGGRSEGRPPPPVLRHGFHPAIWRAIEETAARGADVAELASERTAAWARDAAAVDLGDASTFPQPHPRDDEDASDAALRRALLVEARATLDASVRTADDDDPSPLARFALRQGPDTAAALDAESTRVERREGARLRGTLRGPHPRHAEPTASATASSDSAETPRPIAPFSETPANPFSDA